MPVADNVSLGEGVSIPHSSLVNLYGCVIGDRTKIGTFVEVQRGAVIGKDCKISSHSFICDGVTIEDGVFIGHGVMFTNDLFPAAVSVDGCLQTEDDWVLVETRVKARASIGSGSTLVAGIDIGFGSLVGAGSVVTKSVPDYGIVVGNPAKVIGDVRDKTTTSL